LKRMQTTRLKEFDLMTATSGLSLERIIDATEPTQHGGASVMSRPVPAARSDASSLSRKESMPTTVTGSELNLTNVPYDSGSDRFVVPPRNSLKDSGAVSFHSELNLSKTPSDISSQPVAAVRSNSTVNRRPPEPPAKKPQQNSDDMSPPMFTRL